MSSTPQSGFDSPDQSPGFLLWHATLAWQRRVRAALLPHELTHTQFVLLTSLWWLENNSDQAPTQARLAQQAGTDPMMTSQVIRKLAGRDLVERPVDPTDARARRLRLTAAGRDLVTRALADVEATDANFFASLGDRRDAFVEVLQALNVAPTEMP